MTLRDKYALTVLTAFWSDMESIKRRISAGELAGTILAEIGACAYAQADAMMVARGLTQTANPNQHEDQSPGNNQ